MVWIEIDIVISASGLVTSHHPCGWCGLKYKRLDLVLAVLLSPLVRVARIEIPYARKSLSRTRLSPPVRVAWVEIKKVDNTNVRVCVATRMGGVD